MVGEVRIRRAAIGGAVLLLHFLVLLALLAAFQPHLLRQAFGEREILVTLPVTEPKRNPQQPSDMVPPTFLTPEAAPRPITAPSLEEALPTKPAEPAQPQGDIGALGRYLYNCSGTYYEKLSAKEKAHCLVNKWDGETGPSLTLGPAKASPFSSVVAGRNAPAVPIEKPCPTDKPTANLGMPCYDFGDHEPLVEFHH
jgi:hypothetical protein